MARRTRSLSIFAALLALIMAFWAPAAVAHHKDDHAKGGQTSTARDGDGDADSDAGTTYTENNDSDGLDNEGRNSSGTGTYPNESRHPSGKDRYVEGGGSGNQGNSESNPDDTNGPRRYEGQAGSPDKPNGAGGADIYDQDGNNGCGNDQDFDDDNNGWCGKPKTKGSTKTPDTPCDADATMPGIQRCDKVGGEVIEKPCDADATMPGTQKCEKPDQVQGEVIVDKPCPLLPVMGAAVGDLCGKDDDDVQGAGLEKHPSTPDDSVLGIRVSAAPAVAPAAVAPAAVAASPEAAGAVLPFTGASDLLPLVAVALMLIAIGGLSLRGRRTDA